MLKLNVYSISVSFALRIVSSLNSESSMTTGYFFGKGWQQVREVLAGKTTVIRSRKMSVLFFVRITDLKIRFRFFMSSLLRILDSVN